MICPLRKSIRDISLTNLVAYEFIQCAQRQRTIFCRQELLLVEGLPGCMYCRHVNLKGFPFFPSSQQIFHDLPLFRKRTCSQLPELLGFVTMFPLQNMPCSLVPQGTWGDYKTTKNKNVYNALVFQYQNINSTCL